MLTEHKLSFNDVCERLGQKPQSLFELAWSASALYETFDVAKKQGGVRTISSPNEPLKRVQRSILKNLLEQYQLPRHLHGGVKNRSIVTNARGHEDQPLVIHIDLSNFFGTVSAAMVKETFLTKFNLDEYAAESFTKLTTYGNFLPQGAPTSPTLANIIALLLDEAIMAICKQCSSSTGFHYSRYIDDITISGGVELAFEIGAIHAAITKSGFRANPKKLGFATPSMRQKVTGVVVNRKLNVPKGIVRKIRQQLYYWDKFGLDTHCERIGLKPDLFVEQMKGLTAYVRMIRPELGDELSYQLYNILGKAIVTNVELTPEQGNIIFLRNAIADGAIVSFLYGGVQYRAAPSEIEWDLDEEKLVKAFVLEPFQRWECFGIQSIFQLQLANSPPSG